MNSSEEMKGKAKDIFWKAHLYHKLPHEILQYCDIWQEGMDDVITEIGYPDWFKKMASLSGLKVE